MCVPPASPSPNKNMPTPTTATVGQWRYTHTHIQHLNCRRGPPPPHTHTLTGCGGTPYPVQPAVPRLHAGAGSPHPACASGQGLSAGCMAGGGDQGHTGGHTRGHATGQGGACCAPRWGMLRTKVGHAAGQGGACGVQAWDALPGAMEQGRVEGSGWVTDHVAVAHRVEGSGWAMGHMAVALTCPPACTPRRWPGSPPGLGPDPPPRRSSTECRGGVGRPGAQLH